MAWSNVQTLLAHATDTGGTANTLTATFGSNITTGNRIIMCIGATTGTGTPTIGTPSDTAGNTWTQLKTVTGATDGGYYNKVDIWSAVIVNGGGTKPTLSVTVSGGAADNAVGFSAAEYSGLSTAAGTGSLDVSATNSYIQTTTDLTAGPTSSAGASGELILSYVSDGGAAATWTVSASSPTLTKNTGMSEDAGAVTSHAAAEGTSTTSTASCTWHDGVLNDAAAATVVIKLVSAGGATAVPNVQVSTPRRRRSYRGVLEYIKGVTPAAITAKVPNVYVSPPRRRRSYRGFSLFSKGPITPVKIPVKIVSTPPRALKKEFGRIRIIKGATLAAPTVVPVANVTVWDWQPRPRRRGFAEVFLGALTVTPLPPVVVSQPHRRRIYRGRSLLVQGATPASGVTIPGVTATLTLAAPAPFVWIGGIQLVGSVGAATAFGAAAASRTPAWGAGTVQAANNLLTLRVVGTGVNTLPAAPSGWSTAVQVQGTSVSSSIFYKIAAGGDTAPTVAGVTGVALAAQLAEFMGNATTGVLDQTGSAAGTTSPLTATSSSTDGQVGDLILTAGVQFVSVAAACTFADAVNNATVGVGQGGRTGNGASSLTSHYDYFWGIATSASAADSDALSFTTTNITGAALAVASFVPLAAANVSIPGVTATLTVAAAAGTATRQQKVAGVTATVAVTANVPVVPFGIYSRPNYTAAWTPSTVPYFDPAFAASGLITDEIEGVYPTSPSFGGVPGILHAFYNWGGHVSSTTTLPLLGDGSVNSTLARMILFDDSGVYYASGPNGTGTVTYYDYQTSGSVTYNNRADTTSPAATTAALNVGPKRFADFVAARYPGTTILLTWRTAATDSSNNMENASSWQEEFSLANIAGGSWDTFIKANASQIATWIYNNQATPLQIRIDQEMNANNYPHSYNNQYHNPAAPDTGPAVLNALNQTATSGNPVNTSFYGLYAQMFRRVAALLKGQAYATLTVTLGMTPAAAVALLATNLQTVWCVGSGSTFPAVSGAPLDGAQTVGGLPFPQVSSVLGGSTIGPISTIVTTSGSSVVTFNPTLTGSNPQGHGFPVGSVITFASLTGTASSLNGGNFQVSAITNLTVTIPTALSNGTLTPAAGTASLYNVSAYVQQVGQWMSFYPGDDNEPTTGLPYVDIVGPDGYNRFGTNWRQVALIYDNATNTGCYSSIAASVATKPFQISESGCTENAAAAVNPLVAPAWTTGQAWTAGRNCWYSTSIYQCQNNLTNDTVIPPSDATNWTLLCTAGTGGADALITGGTSVSADFVTYAGASCVGLQLSGPGVPANTYVTAYNSGPNTVTVNNTCTNSSGTGLVLTLNAAVFTDGSQTVSGGGTTVTITSAAQYPISTIGATNIQWWMVAGTGIPTGTYISVAAGSTLTLTFPFGAGPTSNGTTTGHTFTITPPQKGDWFTIGYDSQSSQGIIQQFPRMTAGVVYFDHDSSKTGFTGTYDIRDSTAALTAVQQLVRDPGWRWSGILDAGTPAALSVGANPGLVSVSLPGVTATLTLAAPPGSVNTSSNVSIPGVTATLSLAANTGSVSVTLPGVTAALTTAAPAGSVSVTAPGVTAALTLAASSGLVSVSSPGVTSTLTLNAPPGSVNTSSNITIPGITTTLTVSAASGSVSVTIPGILSTLTVTAPAGSVTTGTNTSIPGVSTGLTLTAPTGTVSVSAAGVTATLSLAAAAGLINSTLPGVTATLTVTAPPGSAGFAVGTLSGADGPASTLASTDSPASTLSSGDSPASTLTGGIST